MSVSAAQPQSPDPPESHPFLLKPTEAHERLWLPLDRLGGAFLRTSEGLTHAQVDVRGLRFLDVTGGPALRSLDLRAAEEGMHLTIVDCPHLEELWLPPLGPGATVHVDFGPAAPHLRIHGAILDYDAAWHGTKGKGQMRLRPGRKRPHRGLWVGPLRPEAFAAHAAVVLPCDDLPEELVLPPSSRCRELHVIGSSALARLTVGGAAEIVDLEDCPRLAQLDGSAQLQQLRVTSCYALATVALSGRQAVLSVAAHVEALTMSGVWESVQMNLCRCREIQAPLTHQMNVLGCRELRRVRMLAGSLLTCADVPWLSHVEGPARLDVDPNGAFEALREAVTQGGDMRAALLASVADARKPAAALRALQLLAELTRAGLPPAEAWQLRERLLLSHLPRVQGQRAPAPAWAWQLPEDLGDRGWMADVRLWLLCRKSVPEARRFGPVLCGAHAPEHLAAVARTLQGAQDRFTRLLLTSVLRRQLAHGARHGRQLHRARAGRREADGVEARLEQRLAAVLRSCHQLRRQPEIPDLMPALCRWVGRCLPCAQGVQLLGAIRALGCQEAGRQLVHLSSASPDADVRRLAAALLMSKTKEVV